MSLRCQLSKVSGVTIVAISASIFLTSRRALAARLRRSSSVRRSRLPPSCARRIRFSRASTRWHAVAADSSIRQQQAAGKRNGSNVFGIVSAAYHPESHSARHARFHCPFNQIQCLDITGSVTIRRGPRSPSTLDTAPASSASAHSSRCGAQSHRSPRLVTGKAGSGSAASASGRSKAGRRVLSDRIPSARDLTKNPKIHPGEIRNFG